MVVDLLSFADRIVPDGPGDDEVEEGSEDEDEEMDDLPEESEEVRFDVPIHSAYTLLT